MPLNKKTVIVLIIHVMCISISYAYSRHSVLIIDGFSNHDWKQTSLVTKWILEKSGLFKVDICTIPADSVQRLAWLPSFKGYDVVIQNTNNIWNKNLTWPRQAEQALERYVKKGGGLYILHSGNNAFSHWKEYNKMIGLGWRPIHFGTAIEINPDKSIKYYEPNEGQATGHGDRFNAIIELFSAHPINKGYPSQWKTANTEVYYFPRGEIKNVDVLSYAFDSTATKKYWPVEWVIKYGKGRVYNSSMGHLWKGEYCPPAYRCIGFQTTMIRAAEWLANKKVSYPIPAHFPTGTEISLMDAALFNPVNKID